MSKQQICPECGGKILFDEESQLHVCDTCGEEHVPDKRWKLQQSGRQKKKDLYTVMPLTSDIAWKPGKIEAKLKETFEEREERERAEKSKIPPKMKSEKKRGKRNGDWKTKDW
ncbi:MAG: hypothetical protein ACFFD4_19555 [Candidatus Odinarchaeota archaeon]